MKTFTGWRAVGRAMRWARQQDGVTHAYERGAWLDHEWDRNSADIVRVGGRFGIQGYGLMVSLADGRHLESTGLTAIDMLRVLAALDLIPAELAEVRDERYGRCVTCGQQLRWVDDGPGWEPRWMHTRRYRADHKAEVSA